MLKHRGFPSRMIGSDFQFTIRRPGKDGATPLKARERYKDRRPADRRADEAFRVLCTDIGHWLIKGFGKWIVTRSQTGEALGGCGIVHPDGWPSHK